MSQLNYKDIFLSRKKFCDIIVCSKGARAGIQLPASRALSEMAADLGSIPQLAIEADIPSPDIRSAACPTSAAAPGDIAVMQSLSRQGEVNTLIASASLVRSSRK